MTFRLRPPIPGVLIEVPPALLLRYSFHGPLKTEEEFGRLVDSVEAHGLWSYPAMLYNGQTAMLLDGHTRTAAAIHLGWETIPVEIHRKSRLPNQFRYVVSAEDREVLDASFGQRP